MVGWHHWLDGHEFEQAPGVGDGQGSLARLSPCSHKELDTTEWLNWTDNYNKQGIDMKMWKTQNTGESSKKKKKSRSFRMCLNWIDYEFEPANIVIGQNKQ